MANNLFITYDLIKTKDYPAVHEAIKALGSWAKVTESNWYVNSILSAEEVARKVRAAMDSDDKLIVINTSSNQFYSYNLDPRVLKYMQDHWRV